MKPKDIDGDENSLKTWFIFKPNFIELTEIIICIELHYFQVLITDEVMMWLYN